MTVLTAKTRNSLPNSDFAVAGRRYPVEDKSHARAALAYINKGGLSSEQKMTVIRRAHAMLSK